MPQGEQPGLFLRWFGGVPTDQRSLMDGTNGSPLSNAFQTYLEWREEAGREFAATLEAASNGDEAAMQDLAMRFMGRGGIRSAVGRNLGASGARQLTGQMHHGISRTVHKALDAHPNLKGIYSARDSRFVTQAKDLASHNGYDRFHRNLDAEVAGWIRGNPNATQAQFEAYLRGVYQRPDVLSHFPNGL